MKPFTALLRIAAFSLVICGLCSPANASVIFGYNADQPSTVPPNTANTYDARFDRFSTNFPSEVPIGNSSGSFVLAGRDLSGVGWISSDPVRRLTMISPTQFVTAAHITGVYTNGTSVSFLNASNTIVNATISSAVRVPSLFGSNNPDTDILLGTLTAPISGINYYPVASGAPAQFANRTGYLYDQEHRVGLNRADAYFTNVDEGSVATTNVLGYGNDPTGPGGFNPGELYFGIGDSGSPTFMVTDNNVLALVGTHYFIQNLGLDYSFDSFLPDYISQLTTLTGGALQITPIPEPGSLALIGVAAFVPVWRRMRRKQIASTE